MKRISLKDVNRIKKSDLFDSEWYLKTYPDVGMAGMDPAVHFLKYGRLLRRDPSPKFSSAFHLETRPGCDQKKINPLIHYLTVKSAKAAQYHYVLWAAYNIACKGQYDKAIQLAQDNLPENLRYTVNILLANKALRDGKKGQWLKYLNSYLDEFNIEPINIQGDGHIISQFSTNTLKLVSASKKISVLMPAWNAQDTIEYSARSILNQTWKNIELLIVDDASQDNTWEVLKRIAKTDSRVKIFKNSINVGPYVSKNKALKESTGDYITGHDADDWAHPQRLEKHMRLIEQSNQDVKASLTYMIRVQPDGFFGHIGKVTGFSFDGVARKASISCMFERKVLENTLGYWDSVRFGADSEMIARAKKILGDSFVEFKQIGMICLDLETSLTNHSQHGVDKVKGVSPIRKKYRDSWMKWHEECLVDENAFLDFPLKERRYSADKEMQVAYFDSLKI